MLLIAAPAPEFVKFMQIVCWIILPVLVSAELLTVFLHYRRKKNPGEKKYNAEDQFMQATPERVGYTNGDGQFVLFDHSDLILEYKNRLSYNHARFAALQQDFAAMETKYAAIASYAKTQFITTKKTAMENMDNQLSKLLEADIHKMTAESAAERKELLASVEQLKTAYKNLEQENRSLLDQVKMGTATEDERIAILDRWKEENNLLSDKTAEQEYLADVVEEKKAQVIFLQNQLEQRIKNLYQSEHQRLQTVAEMKQLKEDNEDIKKNVESLRTELLLKDEQADKMQVILCEKEEELAEKDRILTTKLNHITWLENTLREVREQNDTLNAATADSRDLVNTFQQQFSDEQSKVQYLSQKLFANKQMIRRLYKEFSAFIDDEHERSPVIALRPEYSNQENEENAVK